MCRLGMSPHPTPTEAPDGFEFCGMMEATHTVDGYGDVTLFDAVACCQRVRALNPKEKSPLSAVAEANVWLGCRSIRRRVVSHG